MQALFALITAMTISMVVLPLMVRLSPYIGMMDQPDARKVHSTPIARVGGAGIVLGSIVPLLIWVPMTDLLHAYVMGSIVLFGFGALDDHRELGHYVKFIGQFIAVGIVVFYGGLSIERIPFIPAESFPPSIGVPFTFFAMVGVINAINHSDGLDGLAGGESLLTLLGIVFIAYQAEGGINQVVMIACAVMGGIIGFLRYNTHPAKVFMGDSGSQFLGFTLAFLVIVLTQQINTALSPALPALLLGLPVIDILAVLFLRAKGGMNLFRATRNHIHHRLLDRGFSHQASVVAIYSTQALFVLSALALTYEADWVILMLYGLICGAVFISLTQAEQRGWKLQRSEEPASLSPGHAARKIGWLSKIEVYPFLFIRLVIPLLLIYVAVAIPSVSRDFAITSALLAVALSLDLLFGRTGRSIIQQGSVFICAIFMVYLSTLHLPENMGSIEVVIYSLLAGSIAVTLKLTKGLEFKTTSADYLTLFTILLVGFFQNINFLGVNLAEIALKSAIVLYGCELISNQNAAQRDLLNSAVLCAFGILALRWIL